MTDREFPVGSGDDLANSERHRDFLLARQKETHMPHTPIVKAGIHRLIEDKIAYRPLPVHSC